MEQKIPKIIHQCWVGPKPPPSKWLDTWKLHNPDWEYILWDNKKVFDRRRKWKNQWIIDEYVKRYEKKVRGRGDDGRDKFVSAQGATFMGDKATYFAWHVIADLLRYETLYRYGGYMPGADAECIAPITEDHLADCELYIINTGHLYQDIRQRIEQGGRELTPKLKKIKLARYAKENSAPVMACTKGHWFLKAILEELHGLKKKDLGEAVDTTGNVFMGKMIRKYNPEAKIAYYERSNGIGKTTPFSIHHAGTTKGCYNKGTETEVIDEKKEEAVKVPLGERKFLYRRHPSHYYVYRTKNRYLPNEIKGRDPFWERAETKEKINSKLTK